MNAVLNSLAPALENATRLSRPIVVALLVVLGLGACTQDPAKLIERARQRESQGDLAAAIVDLKSSLQQEPNNAAARFMLGRLYNETFDQVSAEKELRRAKELGAVEGGRVIAELGRALRAQRKYKEILSDVQPSAAYEQPQLAMIHVARGRAHLLTGSLIDARASLAEAAKLAADHPDVRLFDAQLRMASSDRKAAEAIVDSVLVKHPKNFEALAYKGRLLRDEGNATQALEIYDRMLRINPQHFQALVNRSVLSIGLGKLREAENDVNALARVYKGHPQVHIQRGVLQLASGKPREALESAQLALKSQPAPEAAHLLAGVAYLATASPLQAEAALTKYLSQVPGSPLGRRALAESLIRRNEGAKALETLAPLLHASKPDPAAYALAAEASVKAGRMTQASQWYEKAAASAPGDSSFAIRKALIRIDSGQVDQGIEELAGAVEQTKSATQADELLILTYIEKKRYDDAMAAVESMDRRVPGSAVTANLRGVLLLVKGNRDAAAQAFEKALKIDPGFFPAAANLARIDIAQGNPNGARKRYDEVLKANPSHLAASLASAELDALFGNVKGSVELLRRAVKAHPRILEPKIRLATAYVALEDLQAAVETVEDAMAAHPNDPVAFVLAANVQGRAGHVNRALQSLSKLVQLVPSPASYIELAKVQGWNNSPGDAEASLRKALQLQPNHAPAQIALAAFLTDSGRMEEAMKFARSVQSSQANSAIGFMLEGEILERRRKWSEAADAYRAALKREPTGLVATSIYRVRARAGSQKEALAELEQWLAQHPADRISALTAAAAYLESGNPRLAADRYEALLKTNAGDADAMNGLAAAYSRLGDERAVRAAEAAYGLAPLSPYAQDTLGWILVQKGEFKRGRSLLHAANRTLPANQEIRYHLAVALHKSGDEASARKELETLLATAGDSAQAKEARALLAIIRSN